MDCGPRRYLAAISLWGESNNLDSRIERVSGMYFLEKLAGRLGKRDEHVSDVLRKERCPGSREREYLQAMHYRGCMSVTPRILHVVVNRMIVSRNGLEGRGVRIGECAAWCAEDFANAQVFKRSRRYNGEVSGVKGVCGFRYVCCRIHVVILSIVVLRRLVCSGKQVRPPIVQKPSTGTTTSLSKSETLICANALPPITDVGRHIHVSIWPRALLCSSRR